MKCIFIYGPIAAGKLTVAKALHKLTGIPILHNHMINDLVHPLFLKRDENDSVASAMYAGREQVYYNLLPALARADQSIIMTFAYASSFVSPSGLPDPKFVKNLERIVTKHGGSFCPVYLTPAESALYKRVSSASRKDHKKLTKVTVLRKLMKRSGMTMPAPFAQNLIIDNTHTPATKAAERIAKHFKLRIKGKRK